MIAVDSFDEEHEVDGPKPGDKLLLYDGKVHLDEYGLPWCMFSYRTPKYGEPVHFDPHLHAVCWDCFREG